MLSRLFQKQCISASLSATSVRRLFGSRTSLPSTPTPAFPGEPSQPIIKTAIPGPMSIQLTKEMGEHQDNRAVHFVADFKKSVGNYVVDADGNYLLDIYNQISSISVGYNNPALMEAAKSEDWINAVLNRPSIGINPPKEWPQLIHETFNSIAPKGLDQVMTLMCGSCSNEVAYKSVFMARRFRERGEHQEFTQEELQSCMKNQVPGSPDLSIMSFHGAFHGRLFACLSTTRSKEIHKLDIPAFDWPAAPFPKLKYPLEEHEKENEAEEQRCLDEVDHLILTWHKPVAGLIVEPIQAEGGDVHASASFFCRLRELCKKRGVYFIVDEVQTGGGPTGKFWAHEHWGLETPPDVVTFSKKLQAAGFYHNLTLRPNLAYRNFNTWLGDPVRAFYLRALLREMKEKRLLENTQITGQYLMSELKKLQQSNSIFSNLRGQGTFIAIDLPDGAKRDKYVEVLRTLGVQSGGCGPRSLRFRPQLIFTPSHAAVLLDKMEKAAKHL